MEDEPIETTVNQLLVTAAHTEFHQEPPSSQFVTRETFDQFVEQTENFIDLTNKRHEQGEAARAAMQSTLDLILAKLSSENP